MARAVLSFDAGDASDLAERIEFGIVDLDDYTPLWRLVRQDYHDTRRDAFRTLGQSLGTPWPGYVEAEAQYAAIKGRILGYTTHQGAFRAPDSTQLRWSRGRERLYPSLTMPGHPESVFRADPRSAAYGTRVPYAASNERGGGRAPDRLGGHTIPRRPVVAVPGPPLVARLGQRLSVMAAQAASRMEVTSRDVSALLPRSGVGP